VKKIKFKELYGEVNKMQQIATLAANCRSIGKSLGQSTVKGS